MEVSSSILIIRYLNIHGPETSLRVRCFVGIQVSVCVILSLCLCECCNFVHMRVQCDVGISVCLSSESLCVCHQKASPGMSSESTPGYLL